MNNDVKDLPVQKSENEKSFSFSIEGMTCASCVGSVEKAISSVDGVSSVSVNLATESARVKGNPDPAKIAETVKKTGYQAVLDELQFNIEGMSCASCVGAIEKAIGSVPGVIEPSVNLATEKARVKVLSSVVSADQIIDAVKNSGYGASVLPEASDSARSVEDRKKNEGKSLQRSLVIASAFTLPLFLLDMGSHLIPSFRDSLSDFIGTQNLYYLFFLLATGVQFGPGLRFYQKGFPSLLRGTPDMNSLVMLGTSAAYGYSVVATFFSGILPEGTAHVYFEASAVIITLVLSGRYLENLAKGKTSGAIKRLIGLQAKQARVIRNGQERELPVEEIITEDVIVVRPGEKIPVDGVVIKGSSYVDEAMITGEPVPVHKKEESEVTGGTINKNGSFRFRATKVGSDTMLAQIIKMVEEVQGSKLPIQAMVDKVTAWFVPAVLAAAALTFGIWLFRGPEPALSFAIVNAVAVLIIACPCAMGLATPTSIMVGTGKAAELGILFRKGDALQTLKKAGLIAFDKTGTLTKGRPELTDIETTNGFQQNEVLKLAASVESRSEHPIAEALVKAAKQKNLPLEETDNFNAVTGFGAEGDVQGLKVQIGADRYMAKIGLDTGVFAETVQKLADEGKTPLYAAVDHQLAAVMAVADPIKESTRAAIRELHSFGLKTAMITGDNQRTANAIARQLGIDEVIAEVLPNEKAAAIKKLQQTGETVAFVGDGINDAPALAQADAGIAIGTGTDVAIESAEVVLISGDLRNVPNAIALSKATLKNIGQNLFWAFGYNTLLIPVAAGALYPVYGILLSPVFAALAMAASSVCVLANALRLKRFKAPVEARLPARV